METVVRIRKILLLLSFFLTVGVAHAQKSEVSFLTGPLLPSKVAGLTEIMPTGMVRYRFAESMFEIGATNSNSEGANYNNLSVSLRSDFPIADIITFAYTGLDLHYYKETPTADMRSSQGFHFGGGAMAYIGANVWFRSDMKFNFSPGTMFTVVFGFVFKIQ